MKKTLLIAATAAMLLAGAAAQAQPYDGPYGDRDRDGVPNYVERGWDRDHDGRPDDRDRYDNRDRYDRRDRDDDRAYDVRRDYRYDGRYSHGRHHGHAYGRWHRGERYANYRNRDYIVSDYRRYGWSPPPRGYAYYRDNSGDVVLAALASGLIAAVIANND